MTVIQICADDFGQDPLINQAVFKLFETQRLSATSVLIDAPHLTSSIHDLQKAHSEGLEVGLHFNLTLEFPNAGAQSIKPLYQWILLSQCGLISKIAVQQALLRQLTKFEDLLGFVPDYIDGHQHVHQFPGISHMLINAVLTRYSKEVLPWIRNTILPSRTSNIPQISKCFILQLLGGYQFKKLLMDAKISSNSGFLGVYGFNAADVFTYRSMFQSWLKNSQSNTLIMCHPSISCVENDAIGQQRPIEFKYLNSDAFIEDLELLGISISPKSAS